MMCNSLGGNVQGDTLKIENCKTDYVGIHIASGTSQGRGSVVRDHEYNNGHTLFDNISYGGGQGSFFAFEGAKSQASDTYQLINGSTAVGGTPSISNLYTEFCGRIGYILGSNNARPLVFNGGDLEFDPDSFRSDIELLEAQTMVVFNQSTIDMGGRKLFYFKNSKSTVFNQVSFRSDAGDPVIITDQLNPHRITFNKCTRYHNGNDFKEDLDSTYIIPSANEDDYIEIEWWHKYIMVEGSGKISNVRDLVRTRTQLFHHTSMSGNHSWSGGVDTITLPTGSNVAHLGDIVSMQSAGS